MKSPLLTGAVVLASLPAAAQSAGYVPPVPAVARSTTHVIGAYGTPSPGLTLYAPMFEQTAYLIDQDGTVVNSWFAGETPGLSIYLLPNGNVLRTMSIGVGPGGGHGGRIQEVTWDNQIVWSFDYNTGTELQHHDVERLPNGNVLLIAWETLTAAEAVAAGRNPAFLLGSQFSPDHIVEVQPDGQGGASIVWEWHVMDHVIQDFDNTKANFGVVADNPQLIDINFPPVASNDWNHFNGIDYHPAWDQIVVSSRALSEIYVIDHSTTTAEAAGHTGGNSGKGGDILYRWGNPQVYRAGTAADQKLFGQHDIQWVEPGRPGAGNFIVFNNGFGRPQGPFSSIEEWIAPVDGAGNYVHVPGTAYGPTSTVWTYVAPVPTSFYSSIISGVERLRNGNTLVTNGAAGHLFELDPGENIVWQHTVSGSPNWVFRARRYDVCAGINYCTAGTSASGCQATVSGTGSASATAASGFVVSAANVEGNKNGQFYWGVNGRQANVWGNGTSLRCVAPPTVRGGLLTGTGSAGACDGSFAQDLNAVFQAKPSKNPGAGAQVQLQLWYRDPLNTSNQSTSFSDALEFVLCP
jgi:hypothetical protein